MSTCFICNQNVSFDKFYCKTCKKIDICRSCWIKWLDKQFTCPFDKTSEFIYEVTTIEDKNLFLNNEIKLKFEQEEYIFEPLFTSNYICPKEFETYVTYSLMELMDYYTCFYHHKSSVPR